MNWRLILLLSLFGLGMGLLTISVVPIGIEPVCWVIIFLSCAIFIARNCSSQFFWNGFAVSIINSIWVTAAHILWYNAYLQHHPEVLAFATAIKMQMHPGMLMILMALLAGAVSGLVLGVFSFVASKTPLAADED